MGLRRQAHGPTGPPAGILIPRSTVTPSIPQPQLSMRMGITVDCFNQLRLSIIRQRPRFGNPMNERHPTAARGMKELGELVELAELGELGALGGRRVGEASSLVFNDQSRHGRNRRGVITVNRP